MVGFDRTSHAKLFEAAPPHPAARLLNELAVESDAALLVSDTLSGAVYRLSLADRAFSVIADGIAGANGIAVATGGAQAYVVALGADFKGGDIVTVDLRAGGKARLGPAHGVFDGVAVLATGELVISDWVTVDHPVAGSVGVYQPDGALLRALVLPDAMHGPADFAYGAAHNQLWIPRSLDGTVGVIDVR